MNDECGYRKRLLEYSALAATLLTTVAELSEAQIVYTNLEPDVVLTGTAFPGNYYSIDLDNNGVVDFSIGAIAGYNYIIDFAVMNVRSFENPDAIAGSLVSFGSENLLGYPFSLLTDDSISDELTFFQYADIMVAGGGYFLPPMFSLSAGASFGWWEGGVTDKFLGFKFTDSIGAMHFGWARCDVASDGATVTVKDYAYNSLPNTGLVAGEGISTGIFTVRDSESIHIFSSGTSLSVILDDAGNTDADVLITDASGKIIYKETFSGTFTQVDLKSFSMGIYLVTVVKGKKIFTRKIFVSHN